MKVFWTFVPARRWLQFFERPDISEFAAVHHVVKRAGQANLAGVLACIALLSQYRFRPEFEVSAWIYSCAVIFVAGALFGFIAQSLVPLLKTLSRYGAQAYVESQSREQKIDNDVFRKSDEYKNIELRTSKIEDIIFTISAIITTLSAAIAIPIFALYSIVC